MTLGSLKLTQESEARLRGVDKENSAILNVLKRLNIGAKELMEETEKHLPIDVQDLL